MANNTVTNTLAVIGVVAIAAATGIVCYKLGKIKGEEK